MSQDEANQIVRDVERRRRSRRMPMKYLLPAVAALGAGGAAAVASIPDSGSVIHGCYVTDTSKNTLRIGALRLIDTSQPATNQFGGPNAPGACLADESPISWNQAGPQGIPGTIGPQGLQGPPGPAGGSGTPGATGAPLIGETTISFASPGGEFLKIDGIKGESTDKNHPDAIELSSYAIGAGSPDTGGGAAAKVNLHDLTFTKRVDQASPQLFAASVQGTHFKQATLTLRKAGKGQTEFLVVKMTDVLISSVADGTSHSGNSPVEQVSLNFSKIQATFPAAGNSGQKISPVAVSLNSSLKLH